MYGIPVPESELPESIDWKAVLALAQQHAVVGTIINSVQFLPDSLRPSASTSAKMNKFALGLIQTNMVLDRTAARLVAFLEQRGIRGVLLKGQGVARYYPMPQIRQTGDIDFYVGREQYRRAVEVCREQLASNKAECEEMEVHFSFDMGGVEIELHRLAAKIYSPVRNRRFRHWVVEELEHSGARRSLQLGDTEVVLPSYEFDALFVFYHAWHHYLTGGIGLRQLCDWAMIFHSHSADIDREQLTANLRRFGLTNGWKLFACIAVGYLGVPADRMPLYDPSFVRKSEIVLAEILAGGNFGENTKIRAGVKGRVAGWKYGFFQLRSSARNFVFLFPLIPAEATFLLFNRLVFGTFSWARRSLTR